VNALGRYMTSPRHIMSQRRDAAIAATNLH